MQILWSVAYAPWVSLCFMFQKRRFRSEKISLRRSDFDHVYSFSPIGHSTFWCATLLSWASLSVWPRRGLKRRLQPTISVISCCRTFWRMWWRSRHLQELLLFPLNLTGTLYSQMLYFISHIFRRSERPVFSIFLFFFIYRIVLTLFKIMRWFCYFEFSRVVLWK